MAAGDAKRNGPSGQGEADGARAATARRPDRGEETRLRLLDAAVRLFGERGFDGTGTRDLAAAAAANLAAIPYHFGGKRGLYDATADHIADRVSAAMAPLLGRVDAVIAAGRVEREAARNLLHGMVDGFAHLIVQPESEHWIRFVLREQMQPTAAFDRLFTALIGRMAGVLVRVIATLSDAGEEDAAVRLRAISIIGQVLIFRIGRATVLRVTGWDDIGEAEIGAIRAMLHDNVERLLVQVPGGDSR